MSGAGSIVKEAILRVIRALRRAPDAEEMDRQTDGPSAPNRVPGRHGRAAAVLLVAILVSVASAVAITSLGSSSGTVRSDPRPATPSVPAQARSAVRARSTVRARRAADLSALSGGASLGAQVAHGQNESRQPRKQTVAVARRENVAIGETLLASNGPSEPMHGSGGEVRIRPPEAGISQTPSKTEPYWACPHGPCEAIIDPPAVERSGHWALPAGGPLLEGGGERGGYDPQDLQSAYNIPASGGSTQTIALIDAYGYREAESDLAKYRTRYGLQACTRDPLDPESGCFRKVNEKGEEANYPEVGGEPEEEWDVEAALDLDMASAACPHCHILLVEATPEGFAGFGEAVNTAARLGATEISNSYGLAEENCEKANCEEYNVDYDHPGVMITASSGDSGYDGFMASEESPSFPATSPSVVAVGGTSLMKASNSRGWSEEVWGKSGSGCSRSEPKPTWQRDTGCANRTDDDVAAVADPETPVSVYNHSVGGWINVGGTSAGSPLVAGIEAHASEYTRSLPGAAAFYQDPGAVFDVTAGGNGEFPEGECTPPGGGGEYFCNAEVGYDGPTGNGTPDGPLQLASGPPSVTTTVAAAVTGSAATLNGIVDPNDFETTYHFEYGTSISYGTSVPVPDASAGSGKLAEAVSRAITGLTPDTTYHYRLVAANDQGTGDGEDMSFTTAPPAVTSVHPESGPSVGGTTVTISGTDFTGATAVKFGSTNAKSFTVESATSISAVSPAGTAGIVDVTVTTSGGTSATGSADQYLYTQGPKLTGEGESGSGAFGLSVALSADGNTALIGGSGDSGAAGAVWVFTRSDGVWTQQGPKIVGDCTSNCANEGTGETGIGAFGGSVALSADGNTALIGARFDGSGVGTIAAGAAWVFTRSDGAWTQQGAKIVGDCTSNCANEGTGESEGERESGNGEFGNSVALSSDGNTALIGGYSDNETAGAAWVFTRSDGAWTQQGAKIVGDCTSNCANEGTGEIGIGGFGFSVALSSDGNTALIGGFIDNSFAGAAWVFTRSDGAWTQQGSKFTPRDASGDSWFGYGLALSSDGNTALISGRNDNARAGANFWAGAAWLFTRSGSAWTQQGPKLVGDCRTNCANQGTGEIGEGAFGSKVALSSDGNTALISASNDNNSAGAAWLFARSGSAWTQQGQKLTAASQGGQESSSDSFGSGVALSFEGTTALIGAQGEGRTGSAWVLDLPPIPTVAKVEPSEGPAAGGTPVAITGTNFSEATTIGFGAAQATEVKVESATEITAVSPSGVGSVDVTVSTPERTSPTGSADKFTYETPPPPAPTVSSVTPSEGSTLGGTTVTIKGANLAGATEVKFGSTKIAATPIKDTASEIEVESPTNAAETVDVTVTTAGGTSTTSSADRFTYTPPTPPPPVSPVTPSEDSKNPEPSGGCSGVSLASNTLVTPGITSSCTPAASLTLLGKPTVNPKTGAIAFTLSIANPGRLSWLLSFQNGKFGAFLASKTSCRKGQVELRGRCRPAKIVFGQGGMSVAAAGPTTFTVMPSRSARRALKNALSKGRGLQVSALLRFRATGGAGPVLHTYSITVKLDRRARGK